MPTSPMLWKRIASCLSLTLFLTLVITSSSAQDVPVHSLKRRTAVLSPLPVAPLLVGDLDSTFGVAGKQTTNFAGSIDRAVASAVQADGRIVVAGTFSNSTPTDDFALARFTTNGNLDTTFGDAGKVTTDFGSRDAANAIAIQTDGKILVAGLALGEFRRENFVGFTQLFAVARYNTDGSLDGTFGTNGKVTIDIGDFSATANEVLIQPDGKIILAGSATVRDPPAENGFPNFHEVFAVARLNSNGSLDTSFDGDGRATINFNSIFDQARAAALQPDGKIILAGSSLNFSNGGGEDFALARLNADGSLDGSFGIAGKQTTDIKFPDGNRPDAFNTEDALFALALQPDGKIIGVGAARTRNLLQGTSFAVTRYTSNGNLDPTFDNDGKQIVFISDVSIANAVALQGDGRIVIGGSAGAVDLSRQFGSGVFDSASDFALVRLNSDGSLDASFGANGKVTTDFAANADAVFSISLQNDNRIVAAGFATNHRTGQDFALVRYNGNGNLDASFGTAGKQSLNFGGGFDLTTDSALQTDGKIVVGGFAHYGSTNDDFLVARYNADGTPDTTFGTSGATVTDISGGFDRAGAVVIQTDGKIILAGSALNNIALARYNVDGSLDSSFGIEGKVVSDLRGIESFGFTGAAGAVLQPDGKIVLVGSVTRNRNERFGDDFMILRHNPDGTLDTSFSEDGIQIVAFDDRNSGALGVALQADNRIVVVGGITNDTGFNTFTSQDFALARLNTDGTLDATFGASGKVTTDFAGQLDGAARIVIQPDAKLLVAGTTRPFVPFGQPRTGISTNAKNEDFALARYNPNGSLDVTFNGGKQIVDFGDADSGAALAMQPDGRILIAGSTARPIPLEPSNPISFFRFNYDFALARLLPNGVIDPSFASNGRLTTDFAGLFDIATNILLQPDDKIILTGIASIPPTGYDFALARYRNDGLSIGIGDTRVAENLDGTTTATFTIALSAASSQSVSVNYTTASGTAIEGSDFTETSGSVTFAPGEIVKTVSVSVLGDSMPEQDEIFNVTLSGATGATLVRSQGQATILDAGGKGRRGTRSRRRRV